MKPSPPSIVVLKKCRSRQFFGAYDKIIKKGGEGEKGKRKEKRGKEGGREKKKRRGGRLNCSGSFQWTPKKAEKVAPSYVYIFST